jgi:hypothetical protein
MIREIHVRVERFILMTQSNDWIIKCDNRCPKKSDIREKVTEIERYSNMMFRRFKFIVLGTRK